MPMESRYAERIIHGSNSVSRVNLEEYEREARLRLQRLETLLVAISLLITAAYVHRHRRCRTERFQPAKSHR